MRKVNTLHLVWKPSCATTLFLFGLSVVSDSLWPFGLKPTRLLCPWDSPGKNTRKGCHPLLQGIFLTQGLNSHLLHWQADSLPLSHQGSLLVSCTVVQSLSHVRFFATPCTAVSHGGSDSKDSACNAGDQDSIPGLGISPGKGNGNPLQYTCLGYSKYRGAWWATVHGVAELDTTKWYLLTTNIYWDAYPIVYKYIIS